MFAIFVAKIWFQSYLWMFRYALWERPSDFQHTRVAHKFWRDVKFPKLSGMGPVNKLLLKFLHPNICTQVGLGVKCSVHHMKYALHSAFCFFSQPPFISLGITAQNNPSKAHNDSIETRIPTWKWGMSNSRCSRKCSLRIPSHIGFCPFDMLYAPKILSMPLTYAQSDVYIHSQNLSIFLYMLL